jgi:hypothetical protein
MSNHTGTRMGGHISKRSLLDWSDEELALLIKSAIVSDPFRSANPSLDPNVVGEDIVYADTTHEMALMDMRPITVAEYRVELLEAQQSKCPRKIHLWRKAEQELCLSAGDLFDEMKDTPTETYMISTMTATAEKVFTPNKRLCIEVVQKDENDWKGMYVVQPTALNEADLYSGLSNEPTVEWAARK